MKKLITLCCIVAGCYGITKGQDSTLMKIRKSQIRLIDIIAELSATPGYARLTDGNGWTIYLTYKKKKDWVAISLYNSFNDFIDLVRVKEEDGQISIVNTEFADIRPEDFYSYMDVIPQKIECKVIWRGLAYKRRRLWFRAAFLY